MTIRGHVYRPSWYNGQRCHCHNMTDAEVTEANRTHIWPMDGSGRLTAAQIRARFKDGPVLAGASQLMGGDDGTPYREVFPSFTTRHLYGHYNWQRADYNTEPRSGH